MYVLVVESSPLIRKIITSNLTQMGIFEGNIKEANDADSGLRSYFSSRTLDIMILEMELPKMSGIEVIRAVNENEKHPNCAIIVVGKNFNIQNKKLLDELGVHAMMTKPFDKNVFMETVQPIIEMIENHTLPRRTEGKLEPQDFLRILSSHLEEARIDGHNLVLDFEDHEITVDFERFINLARVKSKNEDSETETTKAIEDKQVRAAS